MNNTEEEAVRAVSAAIGAADTGLLSAIDAAQEKWQQELNSAKSVARAMLANVLTQRETLGSSLSAAAQLWKVLKPQNINMQPITATTNWPISSANTHLLASDEQMMMVRAFQNVSHTISFVEFIALAPEALERSHNSLVKVQRDGFHNDHSGNAAMLVEAHAILTAVERIRDVVLLDASPALLTTSSTAACFTRAVDTRNLLEDIVIRGIFADILHISQINPRMLVAAARVVDAEEAEDEWWCTHLHRDKSAQRGHEVRPYGAHSYKKRALSVVTDTLRSALREKERDFGLFESGDFNNHTNNVLESYVEPAIKINDILEWIEHRRQENETVRRFVAPCVPPSFGIAALYKKELHHQFMRLVTRLLHLVHPDGSMVLTENDLIALTTWYSKYKDDIGDDEEGINSYLADLDRHRLIVALQKQCANSIKMQIKNALFADQAMDLVTTEFSSAKAEHFKGSSSSFKMIKDKQGLRRVDLPDIILGCVTNNVKRMLSLKVQGLDYAIAQTVAECLSTFQAQVRDTVEHEWVRIPEEEYGIYICAAANSMARCLEYSEDLRDLFIPFALDENQSDIEEKMEGVIEGFRSVASMLLLVLIKEMTESLRPHASRFYEPHTGTEIMLDIVATLEDYFSEYEIHLLPFHFEYLAIESLKRIVVWYLVPFLRLSEQRLEEGTARRFTSLPTFEEVNAGQADGIGEDDVDQDILSRRSENDRGERRIPKGLSSMSASAVITQIDKDMSNLTRFMRRKVSMYQKKQLDPVMEPFLAIRSLYTCAPTAFGLSDAFRDAYSTICRALRPAWVCECGVEGNFTARVAEVIWESRDDVNPVVLLEAVTMIRSASHQHGSASPTRIPRADDSRTRASRKTDVLGEWNLTTEARASDMSISPSLLWTPSLSRLRPDKN